MVVKMCYRITYGHPVSKVWEAAFLDAPPEFLYPRTSVQFRHTAEIFVTVVHQPLPFQSADEKVGIKRVQVIGYQYVATMKQQEKEEPEIQFRIEKKSFFEQQSQPPCGVGARL